MSDKVCAKCTHWQERNNDVHRKSGICVLNPRVWTGSWQYPTQFDTDTCSHHTPASQLAPVVKGKKSGEKLS